MGVAMGANIITDARITFDRADYNGEEGYIVQINEGDSRNFGGYLQCVRLVPWTPETADLYIRREILGADACWNCLEPAGAEVMKRTPFLRGKGVFGVTYSGLDRRMHGEGLGQKMYLVMLYELARRDAVLVPNDSYESGGTSPAAFRVWDTLPRHGVKSIGGIFYWGGALGPDVYDPQPHARRDRGWMDRVQSRRRDRGPTE